MASRTEGLTSQFYTWESRCRGWEVYPFPVELEPPFEPFFFHEVKQQVPFVDDGKRPTFVSSIITAVTKAFAHKQGPAHETDQDSPLDPFPFSDDTPLVALSVSLPKDYKVGVNETEHMLLMLSSCTYPVSFEIIGAYSIIRIQFVCRETDADHVHNQLKAYFPACSITEVEPNTILSDELGSSYDFGLAEEFMRPLATCKSFDLDPYIGIFGILENLQKGEQAAIQILFQGAVNPWSESIIRSVLDNQGNAFFVDAPEMVKMAEEKISGPLFGVTIRIIGQSPDGGQALAERLSYAVIQSTKSAGNSLIPLSSEGYDQYAEDVMLRQSHRLGILLNSKELATLVHLPSQSVVSRNLERDIRKTNEVPEIYTGGNYKLGINIHQGIETSATVPPAQRLKHTHVIGATGTGKSTFLLSSIVQDMHNGDGIAVLDPHGDLIEAIIPWVPEARVNDIVYIDPADSDYPVGFNILTAHSDLEKEILSSDLVSVFRRQSTSWGDQMNSIFANAILAFLESTKGGTLVDLRRFLIEKSFRESYLRTVTDPNIVYYWQKEFPLYRSNSVAPILTRLDSFLRPKPIRNMVAQKKGLDFESFLDTKKIILVKLSQGLIGAENSYLLGTFIVSKLQQAAMSRQSLSKSERANFYIYIDEFQNFITPSMSSILSGARKYSVGLTLAHQDMSQLTKYDSELANSVLSNAGTRICFRLGDADAKKLESGFSSFDAFDLQNLNTGEAVVRIERPEYDFNISTVQLDDIPEADAENARQYVIALSREKYGTPREEVETTLEVLREEKTEVPYVPLKKQEPVKPVEPVQPVERKPVKDRTIERQEESQHRYMQTLVKKMAESRGFKASIELPTPDGNGRVDVALERNDYKIAIEIARTTTTEWEVHNIEKCLAAGYMPVIICSNDKKNLEKIRKVMPTELVDKVLFHEPESLFLFLDQIIAKEASTEQRINGYRVKVEYTAVSQEEADEKRAAIARAVIEGMRKKG